MARLERLTAKVFADSAPADEIGQFGSALLGTKVLTSNVATIQGLSAYNNGWGSAVISNRNYPTMQEFNGILKVMSYQTAYQMQEGIPEYDASTTYYQGSIVKVISGTDVYFYSSLIDNNTGYAVTNTNYWIELKYVKTTGDTMTGTLTFDVPLGTSGIRDANPVMINASNVDFDSTPSSNEYLGMVQINDQNSNRMGRVEYAFLPSGQHNIRIVDQKNSSETEYSIFEVGFNANGDKYCTFPNTARVDGQWIASNINVALNVNINGSSNITYTVSGLPNDSQSYEILLTARGKGTTTNNQYIPIYVGTAFTGDNFVEIAGSRQMSTTANTFGGTIVIPIGSDRKLTLVRDGSYNGTVETLTIKAYRRIGANGISS